MSTTLKEIRFMKQKKKRITTERPMSYRHDWADTMDSLFFKVKKRLDSTGHKFIARKNNDNGQMSFEHGSHVVNYFYSTGTVTVNRTHLPYEKQKVYYKAGDGMFGNQIEKLILYADQQAARNGLTTRRDDYMTIPTKPAGPDLEPTKIVRYVKTKPSFLARVKMCYNIMVNPGQFGIYTEGQNE